jgi:plastocyanin
VTFRAPLIAATAALVTGACGGGSAATQDAAPADVAAIDAAADVGADAPEDSPPAPDGAADASPNDVPANFVAIAPCPDPGAYAPAAQVSTTADNRYSPACAHVAAGATLTIEASAAHPVQARTGGSAGNPIPAQSDPAIVAFPTPGFYPFLCPEHVGEGMIGVVWVD